VLLSRRRLAAHGGCPCCGGRLVWLDVLAAMQRFGGSNGAAAVRKGRRRSKAAAAAAGEEEGDAVEGAGGAGGSKRGGKKGSRWGRAVLRIESANFGCWWRLGRVHGITPPPQKNNHSPAQVM
jgi:hypothetical protein